MEWPWITGDCWLGCGRTGVLVIWLGPVQWGGQHAPLYACEQSLNRLRLQALAYFRGGSRPPLTKGTPHGRRERIRRAAEPGPGLCWLWHPEPP